MFSRLMIANRGEIAMRIIRACKKLGIESVAVYSQADRDAVYLKLADRSVCIGPPPSAKSYLHIPSIIAAAEITDVEAIHPGYGFLSENSHFAEVCRDCQITFIGPSTETIRNVGDKVAARALAVKVGVPVVPGSDGAVENEAAALEIAERIGYPVIVKAASGGGGRGMRVAHNAGSLQTGYHAARREADAAFGDGTVYLEKFITSIKHIEIQVLADNHGNVVHLGERDCTVQRRHQKLIEESPSPIIRRTKTRQKLGDYAVKIMKESNYQGAGTVEFITDGKGTFYFIEVNARIQVEHPVTEMVTGIDLIEWQIRIAAGERLPWRQKDIKMTGHALECRINAEDPENGFRPAPGRIELYCPPVERNVRVDSHLYSGYKIPPNYDSLLAKIIVHGSNRADSIIRMRRALEEFVLLGVKTTIPFHQDVMEHHRFVDGKIDTRFVEDEYNV